MKKMMKKSKNKTGEGDNPLVTAPQIDKLSGVVNMLDEALHGLAYSTALSSVQEHELGYVKASGSSQYPLGVKIYYPTEGTTIHMKCPFILLQFTSKKAAKRQVRFEYNPSHMTEAGEEYLNVVFTALFGVRFYEFLFHARFTRVDFCRNIMWRDLQDYLVRAAWTKVSHCHFSADGKLETINLGKSGDIKYIAYNKAAQMYGAAADHSTIRIEARCTINLTLSGLAKFANPFTRVTVYSVDCKKPPFGLAHWRGFQDSCRLRGIGNAVKLQPAKYRSALKKALSKMPFDWWEIAEDDWNWLLTDALDNAGLMNIPQYAPPLTVENAAGEPS